MMSLSDFRPIFLYEFKLNQSAAETARKINQAFGNDSVNERTDRRWFAKFRSGDFSLEYEPRSGRPRVIQDEYLRTLVETDPSQIVRIQKIRHPLKPFFFLMKSMREGDTPGRCIP